MNIRVLLLMLFGMMLLNGCASQESFRKMDNQSRVAYVCSREPQVSTASAEIYQQQQRIKEQQALLERGYLVHTSCKTIEIEEEQPMSCKTYDPKTKLYSECSKQRKKTEKRVCSDEILPLNVSLTKDNIHRFQDQLDAAEQRKASAYQRCRNVVQDMSADQAYQYYQAQ